MVSIKKHRRSESNRQRKENYSRTYAPGFSIVYFWNRGHTRLMAFLIYDFTGYKTNVQQSPEIR